MPLKAYAFWIIKLSVVAILAFTIAGFFGAFHRFFEYACSFRFQYFWASISIALIFLSRRYWKWLVLTTLCFAINATQILPLYSFDHQASDKNQKY
jgi:hypothetical protein